MWWRRVATHRGTRSLPQEWEASHGSYWHRRPQEGQPDLHPDRGGELLERRVRTEPDRFAEVLGHRSRARILIESATESEWVARCLEALGHEVIIADPNFAPMYAQRTRKVKTDRRDARALTRRVSWAPTGARIACPMSNATCGLVSPYA